jgi:hypothetical protein
MSLPFSHAQFFEVFQRYNEAVWPSQVVLTLLALAVVALLFVPGGGRWIAMILAALWAWMAIAYHLAFFLAINPAAPLFAALFLAAAAAFAWSNLRFGWPGATRGAFGIALIVYALAGYPLLGAMLDQRYPAAPTFGLPCPTTLFTAGVLLFLKPPFPRRVLVVPLAWALVGSQAAVLLGVPQDFGLIVAAVALAWLALPVMKGKETPA